MPLIQLKSKFLIPRSHESEDLSNVLAKEFQHFLKPLTIIQAMLFCPKYLISNNVVSHNGPKATMFGILGNFFIISLWLMRIISMPTKTDKKVSLYVRIFAVIYKANLGVACLGFVVNMFCNIVQCRNNVKLVLMLQRASNVMKIDKNIFRNLGFWNWVYVISLCLWHFLFYFGVTALLNGFCLLDLLSEFPVLSYDNNVLYAIRISVLIRNMIMTWTNIVRNKFFSVEDPLFCKHMYDTFYLMKCACILYNKVFQDLILYFVIVTFFHALLGIKYWLALVVTTFDIDDEDLHVPNERILCLYLTLTAKRVLMITILSIEVEKLLHTLEEAQMDLTMLLIKEVYTQCTKRFCKNVRRVNSIMSSRICLRGLFYVDSSLPIQLVTLITAYVTLLLQFVILN